MPTYEDDLRQIEKDKKFRRKKKSKYDTTVGDKQRSRKAWVAEQERRRKKLKSSIRSDIKSGLEKAGMTTRRLGDVDVIEMKK